MMLRVRQTDLRVLNVRTRMPFRYGIASLTATPHVFVCVELEVDGRVHRGVAADNLAPKWFTKDPSSDFRDDVADMLAVIRSACGLAENAGPHASPFDLWRRVYADQQAWARGTRHPPLLWNFGVSLVERAVIDAFCRAQGVSFATALRSNALGIRLGEIHPELEGIQPGDLLPARPLSRVIVRHTVGLSDPLTDGEIAPQERVDDGLPQSLEACIAAYGLTHFKIKLCGDASKDIPRLERLAGLLARHLGDRYAFTLDGNEQFRDLPPFIDLWRALRSNPSLRSFLSRLIFVEQPLHRDVALDPKVAEAILKWDERPPMIIDESDATLDALPIALRSGYLGTSHKNCKGIFKGIANACYVARATSPCLTISGEDLSTIGPIALLQDLAVLASLGIAHAERNGQHYFRGLSMLPPDVQQSVLRAHPDLYEPKSSGTIGVKIAGGAVAIDSLLSSPFGYAIDFDPARFTPIDRWDFDSLSASDPIVPVRVGLKDGSPALVRPIRRDGGAALAEAIRRLSPQSRYQRFLSSRQHFTQEELDEFTRCDGIDHLTLVLAPLDETSVERPPVAVAHCVRLKSDPAIAEVAIVVADDWQRRGVGRVLLTALARRSVQIGIRRWIAYYLSDNMGIRTLLNSVVRPVRQSRDPFDVIEAHYDLPAT